MDLKGLPEMDVSLCPGLNVRPLLVVRRFNLYQCCHDEGHKAQCHDDEEECLIAHGFGDESGHHSRQHHTSEILTGCADGEHRRAALSAREGDKEQCVGSESKSVAELLDADACACQPHAGWQAHASAANPSP